MRVVNKRWLHALLLASVYLLGAFGIMASGSGGGGGSGADDSTPDPFPDPVLKIVGAEEIVYDWTIHRCQQDTIPDLAVHAFRDSIGQVSLPLNHLTTYRMIGPDLNSVAIDCNTPINQSTASADPSLYSDKEWLSGFYTEDGETIYALVHNEYQGHTHPGQCPQASYFPCWSNTITLSVSTNGGQTFQHAAVAPSHYVAGLPYQY